MLISQLFVITHTHTELIHTELIHTEFVFFCIHVQQDSADETTTNGSPLHEENGDNGDNGDSVASISDGGSGTPPMQPSQTTSQHGSIDDDLNASQPPVTNTTTAIASIPLGENTLLVDISDALSEKDKVKFTVHTRTTFPTYTKKDFFVVRQHEEFIWLHDRYEENEDYAGYIVSIFNL